MPQTEEEKIAARRAYYEKWKADNPDYYKNRRKTLGESLLIKERERDRNRRHLEYRKYKPKAKPPKDGRQPNTRTYRNTRRARLNGAFVREVVVSTVVFERDLYVCQRCFKQCPSKATVPDYDAPTVDHIVALANGGEHSYDNVQCLCFICNVRKGARE